MRGTIEDWKIKIYGKIAYRLITHKENPFVVTIDRTIVSNKGSWGRAIRELQKEGILSDYQGYVIHDPNRYHIHYYKNKKVEHMEKWLVSREKFLSDSQRYAKPHPFSTSGENGFRKIENIEDVYVPIGHISPQGYIHLYWNKGEYDFRMFITKDRTGKESEDCRIYPKNLLPKCAKDIYFQEVRKLTDEDFPLVAKKLLNIDFKAIGKTLDTWEIRDLNKIDKKDWGDNAIKIKMNLAIEMKNTAEKLIEDYQILQQKIAAEGGWDHFKEQAPKEMARMMIEDAPLHVLEEDIKRKRIGEMALAGMPEGQIALNITKIPERKF